MRTGETITAALESAGLGSLPPKAKSWAAARLARHAVTPGAMNIGGLACTLPHRHDDGLCVPVPDWRRNRLRFLAWFKSWDRAARTFVAVARRAGAEAHEPVEDLPEVGFRSTHPVESERTGDFADFVRDGARVLMPISADVMFGPAAAQEAAFRGLLADWEAYERAGVPAQHPELKDTFASWTRFRDDWLLGRPDTSALNAQIADGNRVRKTLAEKTHDPRWQQPDRRGVDVEESTFARSVAAQIVDRTKATPLDVTNPAGWLKSWWGTLPPAAKVGIATGALLVGGGAITYVTAPVLLALSGGLQALSNRGTQVVLVQPQASHRKRAA